MSANEVETFYENYRGEQSNKIIPAETWHNVVNIGRNSLKVSSVYAPPNYRRETVYLKGNGGEDGKV